MLQIVSGKFFSTDKTYDTVHRGSYYTNYRTVSDDPVPLPIGHLLPSTQLGGSIGTLTYELTEKIEWEQARPGTLISTGGQEFVESVSDVIGFALNVLCTTDVDLVRRLSARSPDQPQRRSAVSRVFDSEVMAQPEDAGLISSLLSNLIALDRSSYENAMRAIRRYVTATHRIVDDASLAYVLFVMSIEALAQGTVRQAPTWDEYDASKRQCIDVALAGAPTEVADRVRAAVLENEHVAVSRRFRRFAMDHVTGAFFRDEARGAIVPIAKPDLERLLRSAYDIRSAFVHRLASLPRNLCEPFYHAETIEIDGQLHLTFQGLARLARHVIFQFVERAPRVEREDFDWRSALPNIIKGTLAPEYWIWRAEGYNAQTARMYLEGFLGQVVGMMQRAPDAKLTDLTKVLDKIEAQSLDNIKPNDRRVMLVLYALFQCLAGPKYQRPQAAELFERYDGDFRKPTIEQLAYHLVIGGELTWTIDQFAELHANYFSQRHHKEVLSLGRALEAVFTLLTCL
ncbi:MAG: hypothetical protein KIS73_24470, partial [Enhydrobacter sp.]|nr:hypothetical protein [Enhydrobacter sp.]